MASIMLNNAVHSFMFPRSFFDVRNLALLATLVPGIRTRTGFRPDGHEVRPESAKALRELQRDLAARFVLAPAREGVLALEYAAEGNVLVHHIGSRGALSLTGGWLGAGRLRYVWLPLRPTLAWDQFSGPTLTSGEIAELAADIHAGLDHLMQRHVLEEILQPVAVTQAEKLPILDEYQHFMHAHGWKVTYDETHSQCSLARMNDCEGPQQWSITDREVLMRLEALVAQTLNGIRLSSRVLYQSR